MNRKRGLIALFIMHGALALWSRAQETILIKNGAIVPVVGNPIPRGDILIVKGKIAKLGTSLEAPSDAVIIDAGGLSVYPGLIAPLTALGLTDRPGIPADIDEVGVSNPQMDPYDAINPEGDSIEVTRIEGVTSALTVSGSHGVINGKSMVINLDGDLVSDMVVSRYAAQIFNMGAVSPDRYPKTLPGVVSLIREKLERARQYAQKKKSGDDAVPDSEMEALLPVLSKEVRALFLTSDGVTIRNALQIIKEYDLKGIVYATSGILPLIDPLKEAKIPVIWAGTTNLPNPGEPFDTNYRMAAVLAEKRALFALDQHLEGLWTSNVRNLPIPASLAVAHGLSEEEAIKALTIYPARILGVDDQLGSLEVGKTANVAIWTSSPLQLRSRVKTVIIKGRIIPLTSRQTRLRDKFEKIVGSRMKKKGSEP